MLNLVQHLINPMGYETLKRVQGDISGGPGQPLSDVVLHFLKRRKKASLHIEDVASNIISGS